MSTKSRSVCGFPVVGVRNSRAVLKDPFHLQANIFPRKLSGHHFESEDDVITALDGLLQVFSSISPGKNLKEFRCCCYY